jgi:hypothetical protein
MLANDFDLRRIDLRARARGSCPQAPQEFKEQVREMLKAGRQLGENAWPGRR